MSEELDFKISSGLKNIIGKELITDDLIAIFEIVKNSYDANAKKNTITFQNITKEAMGQPQIIVSDDGEGMSKKDIEGKFLFVGYSEKKQVEGGAEDYRDKISERRRRHYAGSKGIGRFSCDRLGKKLKIYTKTKMEKEIHTLTIDWLTFEQDQKIEFETVKAVYEKIKTLDIENYSGDNFTNGTILVVNELNSPWDRSKLLKLKGYLQRLINPTQIDPELGFEICLEAKEYEKVDEDYSKKGKPWEIINGSIKNIVFEKMEMKTARVTSEISEDGKEIHTELFDKDQYIFKLKEKNPYEHLKNVKVIVFFLSTSAKKTFTSTMGLDAVNYGSVFLYKNGIRIYPYGEPNEDWLGLDKLKQQGWKRYLGTREVIGRVEVSGYQPGFVEVSSRDGGLLKNECHEELKIFIRKKAVTPLRRYVVEGLDWDRDEGKVVKTEVEIAEGSIQIVERLVGFVKKDKDVDFNPNLLDIFKEKESEHLLEVVKNVEAIKKHVKDPEAKKYIDRQVKAIRKGTQAIKRRAKEAEDKAGKVEREMKISETENIFLKSANLQDKEQIISLFHYVGIHSDTIKSHSRRALMSIFDIKDVPDKVKESIETIAKLAQIINTISKIGFKGGITEQMESDKQDVIKFMVEFIQNICLTYYINIKIEIENSIEREIIKEFAPFEMTYVIDNLISNSKKAGATKILFKFYEQKGITIVEVEDNGRGLNPKIKDIEDIFKRNVSTTLGGAGLGLFDARKILSKMNSEITAENTNKGFKLRIVIPYEN